MENIISFGEILEAASHLPLNDQISLVDILHRRIAAIRREDIVKSVQDARKEYREGKCVASTADEIMADILS